MVAVPLIELPESLAVIVWLVPVAEPAAVDSVTPLVKVCEPLSPETKV